VGYLPVSFSATAWLASIALSPAMGGNSMGYVPTGNWCKAHHDRNSPAYSQHAFHLIVYHHLENRLMKNQQLSILIATLLDHWGY
jgi:hypothetical protein